MKPDFSVTLSGVSLTRGTTAIVEGLSLTIGPSDLIWIGGDNGIGKSSLLKLMCGLLRADSGVVSYELLGAAAKPGDLISYQGHKDAHKPHESVRETLAFWAKLCSVKRASVKPDIEAAMQAVGITPLSAQPCHSLSAGQSRRVALAKLIIEAKPIWIMDEPSAAMDREGQALIDALIKNHIERAGAAIIASHAAPKRLAGQAKVITLTRAVPREAA